MNKLFSKIKKENLNPDEKAKIFSVLRNFVIQNPIQSVKSPFYSEWFVFKQKMFVLPIAITLIFVLTGGTVFAAKNSLPGSKLYPVKMLNEKIQSLTALTPKTQAQIEVTHAISRLKEVEQIVSSKGLSKETRKEIQNNFETQTKEVVRRINKLKDDGQTEDASKIQSDFEKSITEHEKAITELSDNNSADVISDIHSQFENKSEKSKNQGEVKGAKTYNEKTNSENNH